VDGIGLGGASHQGPPQRVLVRYSNADAGVRIDATSWLSCSQELVQLKSGLPARKKARLGSTGRALCR
jgi:hypothetical protein